MKPLENVFAGWNCAAGISDVQHDVAGIGLCADPTSPPSSIVLSRVLQEILHNERRIPFFAGHKQTGWKFFLDFYVERIGKRAKIVQPLVNDLAESYRRRGDFKMASVHARQQKQIVDDAGQTMCLMERSEEHTSELQSPYDLVCRLLLE